nr:HNH endonuclease [Nocardioides luteus]
MPLEEGTRRAGRVRHHPGWRDLPDRRLRRPIRNIDHIERHADGGETSAQNLQGLCERCNQAKEAIGWQARPGPRWQHHHHHTHRPHLCQPTTRTLAAAPITPVPGRVHAARRTPRSHPCGLTTRQARGFENFLRISA